ncbi:chromosome partitioning protein, ParB family [Rhizobium sp. RU35A]|uniref:ParB/RepB/Spo0J family partition protein n=1 Tax=Rhizobium sp. RU35A TaxID=1907414 RepID=UPI0009570CEB|nr:ParB N-terminal domain-containing protein [Rhizobium sp. RU35A]SIR41426.1 chromosome partitioning protein, ParB family [Rhizobium sp. RU35A]
MPDYKQLSLSQILIGSRQRPIDRDYAAVIGASMKEHGQLQPIVVRATPAAQCPYTLVIGGHRCTGAEIHGIEMLDAIVVKANSADAQMLELAENLHRRDLSVLDRAYFVQAYRDLWESKYGKINQGGDQSAKLALCSTEGVTGFSEAVANKLGLSRRAAFRLNKISGSLHPDLRAVLQTSPAADNQSQLLALAKMEPQKQRQMAVALKAEPDVKKALAIVDPAPRLPKAQAEQALLLSRLVTAWEDASEETRRQFLEHIGMEGSAELSQLMADLKSEAA